jgi:hypothetical protein
MYYFCHRNSTSPETLKLVYTLHTSLSLLYRKTFSRIVKAPLRSMGRNETIWSRTEIHAYQILNNIYGSA